MAVVDVFDVFCREFPACFCVYERLALLFRCAILGLTKGRSPPIRRAAFADCIDCVSYAVLVIGVLSIARMATVLLDKVIVGPRMGLAQSQTIGWNAAVKREVGMASNCRRSVGLTAGKRTRLKEEADARLRSFTRHSTRTPYSDRGVRLQRHAPRSGVSTPLPSACGLGGAAAKQL